jgi:transcriptional regulator with XRE-family HTH domain
MHAMDQRIEEFGPQLRQLREERGLSLRHVAAAAGVAPSVLSNIERGHASPTLATTHKVRAALGLSFAEFFGSYRDRPAERPQYVFPASGVHTVRSQERLLRFLLPSGPDFACQMFYEEIAAGAHHEEMETHPRDLVGYILAGELVLEIVHAGAPRPQKVTVRKDEVFHIPAGLEHRAVNRGKRKVRLVSLFLGHGKPLY